MSILVSLSLLTASCAALAEAPAVQSETTNCEAEAPLFDLNNLSNMEFYFSSGVGAWYTDLTIAPDGSFTSVFTDSDMGDTGEGYSMGTIYGCVANGKLSVAEKINDNTYRLHIDRIEAEEGQLTEYIEEEVRYVTIDLPYGLENTEDLILYLPGTPVEGFSEDFMFWTHMNLMEETPTELPFYVIVNPTEDYAFVGDEPMVLE